MTAAGLVRFRFTPENPRAQIGHGPSRASVGRAGDVVDLSPSYAETILGTVRGAGGGPCLVPVEVPTVEPAEAPVELAAPVVVDVAPVVEVEAKPARRRSRRAGS